MTTTNPDTDTILAEPSTFTLQNGLKVEVQRIQTRQLLRLLKIISNGAGPAFSDLDLTNPDEDFASTLLVAIALALPNAEDETIEFLTSMVLPADFKKGRGLSKEEIEANQALLDQLNDEFFNPDLDDLVSLLEIIVKVEAPHLKALGNRLATLLKAQGKATVAKRKRSSKSTSKPVTPSE